MSTRDGSGKVEFTESQNWGIGKSAAVSALAGFIFREVGTLTLGAGGALRSAVS